MHGRGSTISCALRSTPPPTITRAYRPLLRELGITYLTLMALRQHSTGTVSELAQHLDLPAHP